MFEPPVKTIEELKSYIDEYQYTQEQECMFWFGVLVRAYENRLNKIFSAFKERQNLKIRDLYTMYLGEYIVKESNPKVIEVNQIFLECLQKTPEVDELKYYDKGYYFVSGYSSALGMFKDIWMTASYASTVWGLSRDAVRLAIHRGRFDKHIETGLAKKSGRDWIVTDRAMYEVFGVPKDQKEVE